MGKLNRMMANFGDMHFEETLDDKKLDSFLQKKTDLQEEIEQQKTAVEAFKNARKGYIILMANSLYEAMSHP